MHEQTERSGGVFVVGLLEGRSGLLGLVEQRVALTVRQRWLLLESRRRQAVGRLRRRSVLLWTRREVVLLRRGRVLGLDVVVSDGGDGGRIRRGGGGAVVVCRSLQFIFASTLAGRMEL